MSQVTIPRGVNDPFYRYKRPLLVVEQQVKRGGQTVITNFPAVLQALARPPADLGAWLGKKLGTRVRYPSELTLSGQYSLTQLETLLEEYIAGQVRCPQCSTSFQERQGAST
jgi:translation initiation factor 2 beta subunit (eIF-2beta)/eIF-5